jgi:Flp pilus assembly protein TadD
MLAARLPHAAIALVCAVLGISLLAAGRDESRLQRAGDDLRAGRSAAALGEVDGLGGDAGARAEATRGYAHLGLGELDAARSALRAAVRRDPNNWVLQRDYAILLLRVGDRRAARERMGRARALNPRMALPSGFLTGEQAP